MHHVAKALAAQGRGPDNTLVHMSHDEVRALARMGGLRSLPTNPKTGLPEAGLLSTILPMAAMFIPGLQGIGAYMLAGAAGGALGAGIEGGNVLRGGLMGGLTGALGGWGKGVLAAEAAPPAVNAGASAVEAANTGWGAGGMGQIPTDYGSLIAGESGVPATQSAALAQEAAVPSSYGGAFAAPEMSAYAPTQVASIESAAPQASWTPPTYAPQTAVPVAASPSGSTWWPEAKQWMSDNKGLTAAGGLAGLSLMGKMFAPPGVAAPMHSVHMAGKSTPDSREVTSEQQAWNTAHPQGEQFYLNPNLSYTTAPGYDVMRYARGGIMNLRPHTNSMSPMFLQGNGDGMSDSIPAHIDGRGQRPDEPIRVADGEYVVPADAVSHLGNGSSNAGAKKLDGMVSKVRKAKTGKTKQPAGMDMARMMPA